jgi:hypothetical protein
MHDEELNVPDDVLEETVRRSTKCCLQNQNYKKPATFSRNDICKFLLEAAPADQEWIDQKVVLMMGKYGGCRCDQLYKILN